MADEKYMRRALQLAALAKGYTSPNPMVGAVIVHQDRVIGEGYHRKAGSPHAEVNAINSVKDKSLLAESTIYVSLEPCSHFGKTPPCAQLIIDSKIPRAVIACLDPYEAVSGNGIKMLKDAGVDVNIGVLENEAKELNKEFICVQTKNRPYIYLKWAESKDGFIDRERDEGAEIKPTPISTDFTRILVHKLRAEIDAILIGTNTALNDNPSLSTRYWFGKNPTRLILDRKGRIPTDYKIFDGKIDTIIFSQAKSRYFNDKTQIFNIDSYQLPELLQLLKKEDIQSILVEGGANTLQSFIESDLWDEAYIERSDSLFYNGIKSPEIHAKDIDITKWGSSTHSYLRNT